MIARDKFLIVEDRLIEKKLRMGRNGLQIPTFYFERHGRCVVDEELFESALCGGLFWTVVVWSGAKHPKMIFSVREYELVEE